MTNLNSKAGLLETIRDERNTIELVLVAAGDRAGQPGAASDWTIKDVLAHLNGWRWLSVARLEAARDGADSVTLPWPAELGDGEVDYESVNQWIYQKNRETSLDDIAQEARETFDRLTAAVSALAEDDLLSPGRFSQVTEDPIGPAIVGGIASHVHDEHEPDLRAWLAKA